MKDIEWFKKRIEPTLKTYDIKYKFFESGDFGSLNQVEFNSIENGGEIDFWSSGCLGVHFVDYLKGKEIINVFLEPQQKEDKEKVLIQLEEILCLKNSLYK